jgi:hydrogenase maturation protein HypF
VQRWKEGKIVAIKGIGGYLITCDASNSESIKRLRQLKNRPTKPFALMYHNIFDLAEDVELDISGAEELKSSPSPIVLLSVKEDRMTALAMAEIAPNLGQLGVMLPYTPLYKLLMQAFHKPILATSGNKSGATIIYDDKEAIKNLSEISDGIVLNNRDIVIPQDDSVIKFTTIKRNRIIIRRSRGLAPSYLQNIGVELPEETFLCMGASLKSTFTLLHNKNIFVSQFLGDTEDLQAQENYRNTLNHLINLMDVRLDHIAIDAHPNYFSSQFGLELADKLKIGVSKIQHHEAHFWAVLAENGLLKVDDVLGVIWDGTGLGSDGHIWGGEFFIYSNYTITREEHLDYFNFILGDKMPREPRISALSIIGHHEFLKNKFTAEEWNIYRKILANNQLKTSSVGRLFDGAASIILGTNFQSYEGEAAMQLEHSAYKYFKKYGITTFYSYLEDAFIPKDFPKLLLTKIAEDFNKGFDPEFLAAKFHITMAHYINNIIRKKGIYRVAFSGGVFQNGWLVDLIHLFLEPDFELYFHKNLSPNDEGVSFGQLIGHLFQKTTL